MSSVHQVTGPYALRDHVERIRGIERSGALWITVGTIGVDGVDDLITPDSPPFQNGWTHTLGVDAPVSFCLVNGWVHIRGAFTGGGDATVIFELPVGYRPKYQVVMILPTADGLHFTTVIAGSNGDVLYVTTT